MKLKQASLCALLTVLAASCTTPYQRETLFKNGYSNERIEKDRYQVQFRANEHTPPETVRRFALQRAAEVTVKHGYRYFVVVQETDLDYPSLQFEIQCYRDIPIVPNAIDAKALLSAVQ